MCRNRRSGRRGGNLRRCALPVEILPPCPGPFHSKTIHLTKSKSSRVAQLEKKIDGIVSLLAASRNVGGGIPNPLTPDSQDTAHTFTPRVSVSDRSNSLRGVPDDATTVFSHDGSFLELVPGFRLTRAEGNDWLDVYRRDFMSRFPFVIIPKDMDACALYTESEGVFWAVMAAVVPQAAGVQVSVKKWFREYIAEHVVVRQEKKLELLQTILVHLAW